MASSLYVAIRGDYTQFQKDLAQSYAIARNQGIAISNALNNAIKHEQAIKSIQNVSRSLMTITSAAKQIDFNVPIQGVYKLARAAGVAARDIRDLSRAMAKNAAETNVTKAFELIRKQAGLTSAELAKLQDKMGWKDRALDTAMSGLGVRTERDIRKEMAGLQAAYDAVRTSGVASMKDIANAERAVSEGLNRLKQELNGGQQVDPFKVLNMRRTSEILESIKSVRDAYHAIRDDSNSTAQEIRKAKETMIAQLHAIGKEAQTAKSSVRSSLESAFSNLGIKSSATILKEIEQLRKAYLDVRHSGVATFEDKKRAATEYVERLRQLRATLGDVSRMSGQQKVDISMAKLGLRSESIIKREILEANQAYDTLRTTGRATSDELARAAQAHAEKIRRLNEELKATTVNEKANAYKVLNIRPMEEIRASIRKVIDSYYELKTAAGVSAQDIARATEAMKAQLKQLGAEGKTAKSELEQAFSHLNIRSVSAIKREIRELQNSFDEIRTHPGVAFSEQARAAAVFEERLKRLKSELLGIRLQTPSQIISGSMSTLGLRSAETIRNEIRQVEAAYQSLRSMGRGASEDLGRAMQALRERVRALKEELHGVQPDYYKSLGIRSIADIENDIWKARTAFYELKATGNLSAFELQRNYEALKAALRSLGQEAKNVNNAVKNNEKNPFGTLNIRPFAEIKKDINEAVEAFRNIKNSGTASANDIAMAMAALKARMAAFRQELAPTASSLENAFKTLGIRSTAQIQRELEGLRAAYAHLKSSGTASLQELKNAEAALQERTRQLNNELRGLRGNTGYVFQGFQNIGRQLAGMAAAYMSVQAMINGVQELVRSLTKLDALKVAYNSIFEGKVEGASKLQEVYNITQRLGIEFQSAARGAKTFFAAAQNSSGLRSEAMKIFEAFNVAASAMHLTSDQVSGMFLAVGQMISKGKVQAEELRGQLGERLPGAFQLAAKAMNMTQAELNKFIEDGKLTAEVLLPRLADVLMNKYGAAAEEASHSVQSAINRLNTEWDLFKANMLDSGIVTDVLDTIRSSITSLNNTITTLSKYKDIISSILVGVGASAGIGLLTKYADKIGTIALTLGSLVPKISAIVAANPVGAAVIAGIGGLAAAYSYLSKEMDIAHQSQNTLNASQQISEQINSDLAQSVSLSASAIDTYTKAANNSINSIEFSIDKIKEELNKDLMPEIVDMWGGVSPLSKYEEELQNLRKEAAQTGEFDKFKEKLNELANRAKAAGEDTDYFKNAMDAARRAAELGIKLQIQIQTAVDANTKLYWNKIFGEVLEPGDKLPELQETDWRERRDAERQALVNATLTRYSKTKKAKTESKQKELQHFEDQLAKLPTMGLTKEQLNSATSQTEAIIAELKTDLSKPKSGRKRSGGGSSSVANAENALASYNKELEKTKNNIASLEEQLGLNQNDYLGKLREQADLKFKNAQADIEAEYKKNLTNKNISNEQAEQLRTQKLQEASLQNQLDLKEAQKKAEEKELNHLQEQLGFYNDLAQMSGNYTQSIELQNLLIEKQAEQYSKIKDIPTGFVQEWERLKKLQESRDPWAGLVRGLQNYANEATNLGKQLEGAVTNAFQGMEDAFVNFVQTGKMEFTDLANSIIADLMRIAVRASITGPLANSFGGIVSGIGSFIGGLFSGGMISSGSAITAASGSNYAINGALPNLPGAGSGMGMAMAHGGVMSGGTLHDYSNTVVTQPTLFGYGKHYTTYAHGAGLMGEAGPEAIMPLTRTSSGDLGVRAVPMFGGSYSSSGGPEVNINIYNETGTQMEAQGQIRQDSFGNFNLDVIVTQIEQNMVSNAKAGRSPYTSYLDTTRGLNRAGVLQRSRR